MKRSRISRIMHILTTLQAEKSYAVSDFSKMFGTSRRTIFRDLKELQAIGVPYRYDARTGGYTIERDFFLPPVDLSLQEALSLLLLAHKARDQIQLPFKNSALLAALKIENNLPAKIRQYCNDALRNISIKTHLRAKIDLLDNIFAPLLVAVLRRRIVNIRYYSRCERKSIVTDLSAYHLMYNDHKWYVLGKSSLHARVCAFELYRIKKLTTLDKCYIEDKKFDISKYFGRAWSITPEGRLYNIKLKFLPEVAHDVAEVQWHSTQKVTFKDDGSAIVEFRVDGLNEITRWILGYGDQVEVLAPRILRQRMIEIAQKMLRTNQQESTMSR